MAAPFSAIISVGELVLPEVIVGITDASGGVKRLRALQLLRNSGVETYLTISRTVELTFAREPRFLKN